MDGIHGPCIDCKDRYLACHDDCDRYKAWVDERERVKDAKREYRRMLEFHYSGCDRARKEYFKRKRY